MPRSTINCVVDLLSFIALLATGATGLLLKFVLPPRSGRLSLWDWSRHDWGNLHLYLAIGLLALLLAHVTLHWHWLVGTLYRLISPQRETSSSPRPFARHAAVAMFFTLALAGFAGFMWAASADAQRHGETDPLGRHARGAQPAGNHGTSGESPNRGVSVSRGWHGGR
jgi:hypothetical protein